MPQTEIRPTRKRRIQFINHNYGENSRKEMKSAEGEEGDLLPIELEERESP